jgi:hypothetical protein
MNKMNKIWELPFPSSSLLKGIEFAVFPKRSCSLKGEYEDDDGVINDVCLNFEEVEAFRCTYITSCNEVNVRNAYDRLVDCGASEWLKEVMTAFSQVSLEQKKLTHYMIFFDDGPCYEIICGKVKLPS